MFFLLRQIQHLTRYFLIAGVLAFVLFYRNSAPELSAVLLGPAIYLAYFLHLYAGLVFKDLPASEAVKHLGFLLPVTLLYFSLTGFLFKKLWNERGWIRTLTLLALTVFAGFIHIMAWQYLRGYSIANP